LGVVESRNKTKISLAVETCLEKQERSWNHIAELVEDLFVEIEAKVKA
jgi:hypothetical protein